MTALVRNLLRLHPVFSQVLTLENLLQGLHAEEENGVMTPSASSATTLGREEERFWNVPGAKGVLGKGASLEREPRPLQQAGPCSYPMRLAGWSCGGPHSLSG